MSSVNTCKQYTIICLGAAVDNSAPSSGSGIAAKFLVHPFPSIRVSHVMRSQNIDGMTEPPANTSRLAL